MTKQEKQERAVKLATLRLAITNKAAQIGAMAPGADLDAVEKARHAVKVAQEGVALAQLKVQLAEALAGVDAPPVAVQ